MEKYLNVIKDWLIYEVSIIKFQICHYSQNRTRTAVTSNMST